MIPETIVPKLRSGDTLVQHQCICGELLTFRHDNDIHIEYRQCTCGMEYTSLAVVEGTRNLAGHLLQNVLKQLPRGY